MAMGSKDRVRHEAKKPKKVKKPVPVAAPTLNLTEHHGERPAGTGNRNDHG